MSRFGVLAGGWSRCRLLVVLAAVLAMVSSLGAVSSAQAAVVKATLSLSPSTAIRGESVKATGRVPGAVSRPVWVQRKSGTRWVTVAKTKTTRTGSYATKFKAPAAGSYSVRTLAPRVTIARKARAQYVTSTRTLRVVAQTASLALPATLVTGKVATATLTFGPVRVGRAVFAQVWKSGTGWVAVASGKQSAAGSATFVVKAGTPTIYSYRAWTAAASGAPAFAGPVRTLQVVAAPDTTAPGPVGALTATAASTTSIALSWVNPDDVDFAGVTIRRASGTVAPTSPTTGTAVTVTGVGTTSFASTGLALGTTYSYAVFSRDRVGNYGAAVTRTATTHAVVLRPSIAGTVTDAKGNPLAGVYVMGYSLSLGVDWGATTAADGSYALTGLPAADDYTVCFYPDSATGGSADARGYVNSCYDPDGGLCGAPVVVKAGETRSKIDAALTVAGGLSGKVTDAAGKPLAYVKVFVFSESGRNSVCLETSWDGTFTLPRLRAADDYTVCFWGDKAMEGSSGATGYVDECWKDQPLGEGTPVVVTSGAVTAGINVVLSRKTT